VATWQSLFSIVIILLGVVMYGLGQGSFKTQYLGLSFLIAKMLLAVVYQIGQRYLMVEQPVDIDTIGMMMWNNLFALIGTLSLSFMNGESTRFVTQIADMGKYGWSWVMLSCLAGAGISYLGFRCQRRITATSFLVCVNTNKILVIAFGVFALREPANIQTLAAIALVICGSAWYSWDRKKVESNKAMQKNKAVSSSPSSISKNHTSYDGEEHGESSSPLFPEECRNLLAKDDSGDDDDDNDDDDDDDDDDAGRDAGRCSFVFSADFRSCSRFLLLALLLLLLLLLM